MALPFFIFFGESFWGSGKRRWVNARLLDRLYYDGSPLAVLILSERAFC